MSLFAATLIALSLVAAPQAQTADQRAEAERLARSGEHARALEQFQAIVAAHPDDIDARLWIARLHAWMGRPERAIDVYQSIVAVAPQNVEALLGLGSALTTVGRVSDAGDTLNRAEAIAADQPAVLAAQGRLHRIAGRGTLAVAYYERALALDANNAAIREAYDDLRAERAHRVEGTYYFEHFDVDAPVDVPDTHVGVLEVNGRVNDSLRLFAIGQYERKFDRDEGRGGGGFEWMPHRTVRLRAGGLFGSDTIVLPDADAGVDFAYSHRRLAWLASARYLHFSATTSVVFSPGVTIAASDAVALTLRYYRSQTDLTGFDAAVWNDGFAADVTARTARRVWLTAGYARGWESLFNVTAERLVEMDADTVRAGIRFDPAPMSSLGLTFAHEWRDDRTRVPSLRVNFIQRF